MTVAAVVLAASLVTVGAPPVAGSQEDACDLRISADPAHGAHGDANPWTTHVHPRWSWDTTCPGYPTVEAFVVYPSWGGAERTTQGSFHATDAPHGVLSIQVVGVWSRTTEDGGKRFFVTDATRSPRVGVDAQEPVIDPHVDAGERAARDNVTWVNARSVIDPGFEDDGSGVSGRAVRAVGGDWIMPRESGFRLGGEDGARTLQFIVTDRAGNVATHEEVFGLDTAPPTAAVHVRDPSRTGSDTTTLEVAVDDAGAGVRTVAVLVHGEPVHVTRSQEPAGTFSTTLRVPAFLAGPGADAITVRAVDGVGNVAEARPGHARTP